MSDPTRPVPTHIGHDGRLLAKLIMSPTSNKLRAEVVAPPDHAIPVVFVPGIMGSPLLATGDNARIMGRNNIWAWFPDYPIGWVAGFGKTYRNLSPAQRKHLLDPENTRALARPPKDPMQGLMEPMLTSTDTRKVLAECLGISLDGVNKSINKDWQNPKRSITQDPVLNAPEALRRGWGTVMLGSYGEILKFLEIQTRFIFTPNGQLYPGVKGALRSASSWGELKGYQPLGAEALQAAAEFRYPVYAVGYNWLQSNGKAADHLRDCIESITKRCEKTLGVKCNHGVILVTHSMGGLVARMCAKRNPKLIQGIVHGVQPAIGAATAYRRVRAGWEDFAGSIGLGGTGKKIMPVFANAAGPLELLPSHRYGEGWLRATHDGKELFRLPTAGSNGVDPYEQIYLKQKDWWRLMDPAWIDPNGDLPNTSPSEVITAWDTYINKIKEAKIFHNELGDYYHPNSFVHYGADEEHRSFRNVTWEVRGTTSVDLGPLKLGKCNMTIRETPPPSPLHAQNYQLTSDDHEGSISLTNDHSEKLLVNRNGTGVIHDTRGDGYLAELLDQDEKGDGTVPAHAAEDAALNAVFSARMSGFEHQDSYKNEHVKNLTLYSILRIGATAKVLK